MSTQTRQKVKPTDGMESQPRGHNTVNLGAMRIAENVGIDIARRYPQVADHYRDDMTAPQIVERYQLDKVYNLTRKVATSAIYYSFRSLLTEEEREEISREHKVKRGIELGKEKSIKALCSRGLIPWSKEEEAHFVELYHDPEYQYKFQWNGPCYAKISAELRRVFGTNRTVRKLQDKRKYLKGKNML